MKAKLSFLVVAIASICTMWAARAQQSSTADVERYIRESERQWAESVANGDASVVERILADDFLGVDPDGSFYEKAKMVADTREAPKEFISNRLNDVKVRFFGDTAVAQGNESWVRRTVTPLRGRFVWTDTWILRNGAWQIVASEDLIVPEPAQKTSELKTARRRATRVHLRRDWRARPCPQGEGDGKQRAGRLVPRQPDNAPIVVVALSCEIIRRVNLV